jgi:hypothetical protein
MLAGPVQAADKKLLSTFAESDYSYEDGDAVIYFEDGGDCDAKDPYGCEVVEFGCADHALQIIIPYLTDRQVSDWLRKSRNLTTASRTKMTWSASTFEISPYEDDWVAYVDPVLGEDEDDAAVVEDFFADLAKSDVVTVAYGGTTQRLPALAADQANFARLKEQCTRPSETEAKETAAPGMAPAAAAAPKP